MSKEILTLGNIEIEKNNFYRHKDPPFLKDEVIEKELVPVLICHLVKKDYKYLIGFLYNDHKVNHYITRAYVKSYDGQTNLMYVLIEDNDLLKKCNTFWDKVSPDIKKEFDSEPSNNKEFLKAKM